MIDRVNLHEVFKQDRKLALQLWFGDKKYANTLTHCVGLNAKVGMRYQFLNMDMLKHRTYGIAWIDDQPAVLWLDCVSDSVNRPGVYAPIPADWIIEHDLDLDDLVLSFKPHKTQRKLQRKTEAALNEVDLDEVMEHVTALRELDKLPFDSLVFKRNGQVVPVDAAMRSLYRFTGLSNTSFVRDVLAEPNISLKVANVEN